MWPSFRYLETPIRLDTRIRGRRALTGRLHQTELRRCNQGVPVALLPGRCTWRAPDAHGRVILIGDSNAGHFVEPAAQARNDLGYDHTVATYPDCPFVDLVIRNPIRPAATPRCRSFVTQSLRQIVAERPSLVLVAASGQLYLSGGFTLRNPASKEGAATPDGRARIWSKGLARVLRQVNPPRSQPCSSGPFRHGSPGTRGPAPRLAHTSHLGHAAPIKPEPRSTPFGAAMSPLTIARFAPRRR